MARILIAEDERDIRELVSFTLTFAGHTVTQAANGAEAVERASQVQPDLIMMDVRMPKLTGYEACRQMKAIDTLKDVPIVFLSAKGQDEEVQAGIEMGAYAYILKPFAPDELIRRVSEILAQAAEAAQLASAEPVNESASEPVSEPSRESIKQDTQTESA